MRTGGGDGGLDIFGSGGRVGGGDGGGDGGTVVVVAAYACAFLFV